MVDLGSRGGLTIDLDYDLANHKTIRSIGNPTMGLGGEDESDLYLVEVDIDMGMNLPQSSLWARTSRNSFDMIGLSLLKQFNCIIDWKTEALYLAPTGINEPMNETGHLPRNLQMESTGSLRC